MVKLIWMALFLLAGMSRWVDAFFWPSKKPAVETVDCGHLGRFEVSSAFQPLPPPKCVKTQFFLCRRGRVCVGLKSTQIPLDLNLEKQTIFLVHGFTNNHKYKYVTDITSALLRKADVNVVQVDWSDGAGSLATWLNLFKPNKIREYRKSAANTRVVGAAVAQLMQAVAAGRAGGNDKLWCIGFSLGAHVCGHAGRALAARNQTIARITGLDPAGPDYRGRDRAPETRLGADCAQFVDVIHTDGAGKSEHSHFGLLDPLGHVDFYPHRGQHQAGCNVVWSGFEDIFYPQHLALIKNSTRGKAQEFGLTCSHARAPKYFLESINNEACFTTNMKCTDENRLPSSCVVSVPAVMGYGAQARLRGRYWLETKKTAPYCRQTIT